MGNPVGALRLYVLPDGRAPHGVYRRSGHRRADRAVEAGHRLRVDSCAHFCARRLCRKPARGRRHVDRAFEHAGHVRRCAVDDPHNSSRCRRRNGRSGQCRIRLGRWAGAPVAARATSSNSIGSHRRWARCCFHSRHRGRRRRHRGRPHAVDHACARTVANCAQIPRSRYRGNRWWPLAQLRLGCLVVMGSARRPCADWQSRTRLG